MPIKPENKGRYPADWPQIRQRILERAGHQCEHPGCVARQYAVGRWLEQGVRHNWYELEEAQPTYQQARQRAAEISFDLNGDGPACAKIIVIVLTIAHLDHQPENCTDENLRALCQRHHLAHDHQHHLANAQATRRAGRAVGDLFAEVPHG